MNQLKEIVEKLNIDNDLEKIILREVIVPYHDDYNSVDDKWHPHPPCLIPIFLGYGASYKGVINHFFFERENSFIEYFLEQGYFSEVARNSKQLITKMILEMIITKDGVSDEIASFCKKINFLELDKVDEFTIEYGDNPDEFDKLVHYESRTPLKYIKDLSRYDGDFPSSIKELNSKQLNNACSFEIATNDYLKNINNLPLWLNQDLDKKKLFKDYFSKNQLKEAWLTLNSKGWLLKDVADGLETLKTTANNRLFDLVANNWIQGWKDSKFIDSNY